jgi:hypothetical protein
VASACSPMAMIHLHRPGSHENRIERPLGSYPAFTGLHAACAGRGAGPGPRVLHAVHAPHAGGHTNRAGAKRESKGRKKFVCVN